MLNQVLDHIASIAWSAAAPIATFLLGRYWGILRDRQRLVRGDALDRVNISLNILRDGQLKIRTILERPVHEVFHNQHFEDELLAKARKATPDNAVLIFSEQTHRYAFNCVLNTLAEQCARGPFTEDAHQTVVATPYVLALTCEPVNEQRYRKVRALMIQREVLTVFPYFGTMPQLEQAWHSDRVNTLRQMAQMYKMNPELFPIMEICA